MAKSNYVRLLTTKSHCGECDGYLTLIQHREMRPTAPMFYICWECQNVIEAGVGDIVEEE
jgi:hypothetical protein